MYEVIQYTSSILKSLESILGYSYTNQTNEKQTNKQNNLKEKKNAFKRISVIYSPFTCCDRTLLLSCYSKAPQLELGGEKMIWQE